MNYNKLVSVVMPVHNGEKYLCEAIESVLNQTYKNFEFLIIENCSTDSSSEIIKSFVDKRIRIIVENKCGLSQAYNRGFQEAKGDFIIVHDQDDISFTNRIESQIKYITQKQLDICGSGFVIINDKNEQVKSISPPTKKEEIAEKIFYDFFAIFNPTLIIKKSVLKELGYFNPDLKMGADYDFLLRSLNKYDIGNNPEFLLKYRYHKDSTSKKNKKMWENDFNLSLKYYKKYQKYFSDEKYVLSRIYYYYGFYAKSAFYNLLSIFGKGLSSIKLKYLLYTTVFALPIYLLRKTNMFFNKRFVSFTKFLSNYNK